MERRFAVLAVFVAALGCGKGAAFKSPPRHANDGGAPAGGDGEEATDDAPPDAPTATGTGTGTEAATSGAAPCASPRHVRFELPADVALGCDAQSPVTIMSQKLDLRGNAVGLFQAIIKNNGASPLPHFWNISVAIGKPSYSYGLGDDHCTGMGPVTRGNLGAGLLSDEKATVVVKGVSGSTTCTSGFLQVAAGSLLDLWVEDDRPECAGKAITLASHYEKAGTTKLFAWSAAMAPVLSTKVAVPAAAKVRVLSAVEGSPQTYPVLCGKGPASGTLVSQVQAGPKTVSTSTGVVPGSGGGMTHLVLHSNGVAEGLEGDVTVKLLVGSNLAYPVNTGGCCGDAVMAVVLETP